MVKLIISFVEIQTFEGTCIVLTMWRMKIVKFDGIILANIDATQRTKLDKKPSVLPLTAII